MTFQELEKQLLALTPDDKARALRILVLDLAAWPGIEKTPDVVGGEAHIVRTRIPVWVLDGCRRAGWSEAKLLDHYPTLHAADLVNAWAYANAHPEEIERAQCEHAKLLSEAREEAESPRASLIGAAKGGFATPEEVDQFIKGEYNM